MRTNEARLSQILPVSALTLTLLAFVAGDGVAQCEDAIDQGTDPAAFGATNVGSDYGFDLGQSFTVDQPDLSAVEIFFAENTPEDQLTPIRVTIWESGSLDFTSGLILGSVVEDVLEGPTADESPGGVHQHSHVFEFESALELVVGETYFIQVAEEQQPSDTDLSWRAGLPYAGGQAVKDGAPSANWSDFAFKTFWPDCGTPLEASAWSSLKGIYDR